MIMNRTVLRMAVVTALSNYSEEPWPTRAGNLIFDSKISTIDGLDADKVYPMCVIYSDYDYNGPMASSYKNSKRSITLTFELFIGAFRSNDGEVSLDCPETDTELELALDIFEAEIYQALQNDTKAADTFQSLINGYDSVVSRRGASVEGGIKVAARQITMEVLCDRDPSAGAPSDCVEDFLNELKTRGVYQDYVEDILKVYSVGGELTSAQQAARRLNYPSHVREILGIPARDAPVSKNPEIVFLDANGQ